MGGLSHQRKPIEDRPLAARGENRDSRPLSRKTAEILAMAAHDLRNPINAMTASAELLRETCPGLGSFELGLISNILSAGEATLHLIADLLDLSLETHGALNVSNVDLATVVRDCVAMQRPLADQKRVTLNVTDRALVSSIAADRSKIFRAVNELLYHAIDVSNENQTVEIGWYTAGRFVGVTVRDLGPVISAKEAHQLFMPFGRGKLAERVKSRHNRGLGLAIVNTIARAHGGRVRVNSGPEGTRFTIAFPANRNDAQPRNRRSRLSKAQSR